MSEPITNEDLLFEAQRILDELAQEKVLPFPLVAQKIEPGPDNLYTIYFYDRRFYSFVLRWVRGQSFRQEFREAMLRQTRLRGWMEETHEED